METKLVRIGNSRGVRIPKSVLAQCGIEDNVELTIHEGSIVLRASMHPRAGWESAAREMSARGDDVLIDASTPTDFDESEWEW